MAYPVAIGSGVVAVPVAVWLRLWLRTHGYRHEDEAHLPPRRHVWVLVAVPLAAMAVVASLAAHRPALLATVYAVPLLPLAALVAIDLDVHRLPNRLTYRLVPLALLVAVVASVAAGDWSALRRAALAGIALLAGYTLLLMLSLGGAGLGLGDVKLSAALGVLLGWFSWSTVLLGAVYAFVLAGVWAAALLALRRATRHTHIAFGPFMAAGAVLALLSA